MNKKLPIILLTITILFGLSACNVQKPETNSVESNLKQINQGIKQFSELKNGTLEVSASIKAEKNAVKSLITDDTVNTLLTTFVSNRKGYDYIQEASSLNKTTKEIQYSASKQVHGAMFYSFAIDPSAKERTEPYEWEDIDGTSGTNYKPDGALQMIAQPSKLLSNKRYIGAITREKTGSFLKYTVTANSAYSEYIKDVAHSQKENYVVREHREIYWIDADGLLIKSQVYDDLDWTIDGIADHYISDTTVTLTGFDYKKLKEIGEELPPMIRFDGELYTLSPVLLDINLDGLTRIGKITTIVGSVQEPEQNNQANRFIKNAVIYQSGENSIIVKSNDYRLYEKKR